MTSYSYAQGSTNTRYETNRDRLMTLYVTRQKQSFVVSNDLSLVDIELIRSSVELVGEPGFAGTSQIGKGVAYGAYDYSGVSTVTQFPCYGSTVNALYSINSDSSMLNGKVLPNAIVHKPHLNHGWLNIAIEGMTENRQFMQDERYQENQLSFVVPTDNGLLPARIAQQQMMGMPLKIEGVKLRSQIEVDCEFAGTAPRSQREARFVEDFADSDPDVYRELDGTVKYFTGLGDGPCQIPANMINCVVLQFLIKPRSTV